MMTLDDLKAKLPSFKALLATKLDEPIATCEMLRPENYTSHRQEYRQALKDGRDDLLEFQDILLSNIQGFIEDGPENKLENHLLSEFGGSVKLWRAYLPQLADKLAYPSNESGEGKKTAARVVWDVKKKYIGNYKEYFDEGKLLEAKKLRKHKHRIFKILYDLVELLEKATEGQSIGEVSRMYLDYCSEEEKLKTLIEGPPKKLKKKKGEASTKIVPQAEQKSTQAVTEEVEPKKTGKEEAITENSTPQKRLIEIEEQKEGKPTDEPEKRAKRKRVPRKFLEQQPIEKKSKPKKQKVKVEKPKIQKVIPVENIPPMPVLKIKVKTEMEIEKPAVASQPRLDLPLPTQNPITPVKAVEVAPVKPNNQKKLFDFFSKKEKAAESPMKIEPTEPAPAPEVVETNMEIQPLNLFDQVLKNLYSPQDLLEELRQQFTKPTRATPKQRFVHMFVIDSGFYLNGYDLARDTLLASPVEMDSEINYEDSYEEYDDYIQNLKADNLDKEEQKSQDDEEPASDEGTIVPDGYLSRSQVSSESEAEGEGQNKMVANEAGGKEWSFQNIDRGVRAGYMIIAVDDDPMPLAVKTQKEKINSSQKLQFLRVLHGSYEAFEELILKLKEKLPDMNKHQIRLNISELSQKEKGCPRLIKPYFLTDMEELILAENINLPALIDTKKQEHQQQKSRRREDRRQLKQSNQKNSLFNYTKPEDKPEDKPEEKQDQTNQS